MSNAREQIIAATCDLLEAQGYHGTGLSQIIKESGAPKGSLYYYFPAGKAELAAEAIGRTAQLVVGRIRQGIPADVPLSTAFSQFVLYIADQVERSGFRAGGPLTTVAMETATTNEVLNQACQAGFRQIEAAFAERLLAGGVAPERATSLASFITAAIEGGIILSRTYHSGEPLRRIAASLGDLLAAPA